MCRHIWLERIPEEPSRRVRKDDSALLCCDAGSRLTLDGGTHSIAVAAKCHMHVSLSISGPGLHSMSVLPARASIEYTCRLLRSFGVDLAAESLRQAKFDSHAAYQPLLQAVHDLALCTAAGLPVGCGDRLRSFKLQLQHETLEGLLLPPEGVSLLLHLLLCWGCPTALVTQLSLPQQSSRACLMALAWLISYAKLFDRALQHLQIPQQLLQLLPPYPQDTSCTSAAQQHCTAATTAARQHATKVLQALQPSPASGGSASCWQQVQVAAHHLLSTYRAASMRLQLLMSLQEGREKLLHDIQLQQNQQMQSSIGEAGSSSRAVPPLTGFELHLINDPQLLSQHQEALQRGCSLLQQQLQCVQAAQTFFAWAESVVAEAQKPQFASEDMSQRQQEQQHPAALATAPSVADMLPLVQQLPPAGSSVAAVLLQKVVRQLEQAAAQTGIDLQQHSSLERPDAQGRQLLVQYQQTAAVAMVQAGVVCVEPQELFVLPADLQQLVEKGMEQQQQKQDEDAAQCRKQWCWNRKHVGKEQLQVLVAQGGSAESDAAFQGASADLKLGSAGACSQSRSSTSRDAEVDGTTIAVAMSAELQRLGDLALQVAKQLARTRAGNKEQLQLAADVLLRPESGCQLYN